jgi:hypothetical protein
MQKSIITMKVLTVVLMLAGLTGCGSVEWFPETSSSTATAPTAFTLATKSSIALSTLVQSDTVTLSGFTNALTVSVSGGDSEFSINGGTFTSTATTILPNQTLRVQHTSASTSSTSTTTTVTVGTYTTTFTSVTVSS